MKAFALEYRDLIGIPFKEGGRGLDGLDCVGVTRIVLLRSGLAVPKDAFPEKYTSLEEVFVDIRRNADPTDMTKSPWAARWKKVVGRDVAPGDVIFCFNGIAAHVCPVVSRQSNRPTYVLTTTPRHGVRPMSTAMLKNIVGYYRLVR